MHKHKYKFLKCFCILCSAIVILMSSEFNYAKVVNPARISDLPKEEIADLYSDKLPVSVERLSVFPVSNDQAAQIHIYLSRPIRDNQLAFSLSKDKKQLSIILRGVTRHTLIQRILDKLKTKIIDHISVIQDKDGITLLVKCNIPISYKFTIIGQDINVVLEVAKAKLLDKPSYKHGKYYPVKQKKSVVSGLPFSANLSKVFAPKIVSPPVVTPPSLVSQPGSKNISLNFQSIKIRALLQLIAEFAHKNIVISDSVKGEVSLHLTDLPWNQALNIVLRSQGLSKRLVGNVIIVAPQEELAARELQELQNKQQAELLLPLQSAIIRLHYAKAKDLSLVLKDKSNSLLSSRGQISVDARTNTLWIKDIASNIAAVRRLVRRLDIPVKQVLIEARIVTLRKQYERNLGVKFGLTGGGTLSGTLNGANEMVISGMQSVPVADRLNFDLGAEQIGTQNPASIGLALFKLARNLYLDLELSALEQEGYAHIVSSPRVVTSNQQTATIETGEEIPYQEATSSGATNVAFKKAVLSLNITPRITPRRKIILDLQVNEDQRGAQIYEAGPPAINTQQIKTQVLLNDGETIVLGGVYKQTKRKTVTRVPFLGTLPVVGNLFKRKAKSDDRAELLIFITPRVINTAV